MARMTKCTDRHLDFNKLTHAKKAISIKATA